MDALFPRKRRKGAGRKPNGPRAGVSHLGRQNFATTDPVHVTLRTVESLRGLRGEVLFPKLRHALRLATKDDFRVVHFTVMGNHVHLIVEAAGKEPLARGMQGLAIRVAKTINKHLGRRGTVWDDRYHATVLGSPTQVRHALAYVLNNFRRHAAPHGRMPGKGWVDPCSSAAWFTDWTEEPSVHWAPPRGGFPSAQTWLLRDGWKKAGLIDPDEVPGPRLQ
jgi:REP element-mobilizing transposase RayT